MPTKGFIPLLSDAELTLLPWREVPSLPGIRDDLVASCNDPDMVRWTTIPNPYTGEHADDGHLCHRGRAEREPSRRRAANGGAPGEAGGAQHGQALTRRGAPL